MLNDSIYRIPRNQRAYVWNEHNWRDLFEDIKLVTEGIASSHFIGSIVLMEEREEDSLDVFTIIDGQQRIITLTLLLSSLMFAFKKRGMISDARGTIKYLVAKDTKDIEHVIVAPENHLSLMRIVKGVIAISSEEAAATTAIAFSKSRKASNTKDELIIKAFQYFSANFINMSNEELLSFRDAVISVSYVNIKSSTEEDSYTIFEILNARGIELEDHELLKNYIMRYIHPAEKRDDAKQIWSEIETTVGSNMKAFLRHYAIQRYRLGKGDDGPYKKIRDYLNPKRASDLLYDLRLKTSYYSEIVNPTTGDRNAEILSFLKAHNVRVFRPLLMSLMHAHETEQLTDNKYNEAIEFIYRFYICYKTIGGMESNHLTDSVVKHSYLIELNCTQDVIDDWRGSFNEKLPSREAYKSSLLSLGWSHVWPLYNETKLKERCKLVLLLLEELKSGERVLGDYTIEHALPDSGNQENALIGNLLLLEGKLNERCKDKTLKEKLPIYLESRFKTTRDFAKRYRNTDFDIEKRIGFIADDLFSMITS